MSASAPSDEPASPPSAFFEAQRDRIARVVRGSAKPVADLACGRGRHSLAAAASGLPVVAVDRKAEWLQALAETARERGLPVRCMRADLENRGPILPVESGSCAAVLVFRFLYRPLASEIERILAPGGLLLYETFTRDQPSLGWGPRSEPFLLAAGELPTLFPKLRALQYEEGLRRTPRPEYRASLAAEKPL